MHDAKVLSTALIESSVTCCYASVSTCVSFASSFDKRNRWNFVFPGWHSRLLQLFLLAPRVLGIRFYLPCAVRFNPHVRVCGGVCVHVRVRFVVVADRQTQVCVYISYKLYVSCVGFRKFFFLLTRRSVLTFRGVSFSLAPGPSTPMSSITSQSAYATSPARTPAATSSRPTSTSWTRCSRSYSTLS